VLEAGPFKPEGLTARPGTDLDHLKIHPGLLRSTSSHQKNPKLPAGLPWPRPIFAQPRRIVPEDASIAVTCR